MVKQITTRSLPIPGVPHHRHQVLLNGKVIHSQISALGADDVASAVARYEQAARDARAQREAAAAKRPTHAVCAGCKDRKPISAFPRDWSVSTGRKKKCKQCENRRAR